MRRLVLLAGLACLTLVAGEAKPSGPAVAPTVMLDATRTLGPVRRLNGMNNTVPLVQTDFPEMSLSNAFARLRIPYTRFHDAALENPGYELIDVSRVFPLFDADPDDPKSYVFEPTDAYLAGCRALGSEIEYRLGESIELSRQRFKVKPPRDNGKWAEVCAHIVRHYSRSPESVTRAQGAGLDLTLGKPVDVALVKRDGKWRGLVQVPDAKDGVPSELKKLTDDWRVLVQPNVYLSQKGK